MTRQCQACGKHVRITGWFAGWHLCRTEDEVRKHGTYAQAKRQGRLVRWAQAINADIDADFDARYKA